MRPAPWSHLEPHRYAGPRGERYGAFQIPHPATGVKLRIVASSDGGWEHVSVSLPNRTPNWREMEHVCRLFWDDEEAVMQLHPPRSQWVSNHPHCLHLWKPTDQPIPLPHVLMVGIPGVEFDPNSPRDRAAARAAHALMAERAADVLLKG